MSTTRRLRRTIAALARKGDPEAIDVAKVIGESLNRADDVEYVAELESENEELSRWFRHVKLELEPQLAQLADHEISRHHLLMLARKVADLENRRTDLTELPRTLPEVIEAIESVHVARVAFTTEARASAEKARFNETRECPFVAWRLLRAMATDLVELYCTERVDIPREFQARTGFELSMSEGRETKRNPTLMRLRTLEHECGVLPMDSHAKFGTSPPRLLRVHYAFCRTCHRVVVGHCGDHLPTASRRR